jgi:putative transposase
VTPEQAEIARLRAELARVKMSATSQKSRGVLCAGCSAKYAWIRSMKTCWPITLMCEVLEVSPSGYFSWEAAARARPQGAAEQ